MSKMSYFLDKLKVDSRKAVSDFAESDYRQHEGLGSLIIDDLRVSGCLVIDDIRVLGVIDDLRVPDVWL